MEFYVIKNSNQGNQYIKISDLIVNIYPITKWLRNNIKE